MIENDEGRAKHTVGRRGSWKLNTFRKNKGFGG